jgi:hypothetical protein
VKYNQIVPYLYEIRETTDSALYQLEHFERTAEEWLTLRRSLEGHLKKNRRQFDQVAYNSDLNESASRQTHIFDSLEAFLAAWARLSLLIFPLRGHDDLAAFRVERASVLQWCLGLDDSHVLNNRALRDAWMHFDERLDRAVANGHYGNRQRFVHSSEAYRSIENTLRLVEIDTMVIHFRDRDGLSQTADLKAFKAGLFNLKGALSSAWENARNELPIAYEDVPIFSSPDV